LNNYLSKILLYPQWQCE